MRRWRTLDAENHGWEWNILPQGQKLQNTSDIYGMYNNPNESDEYGMCNNPNEDTWKGHVYVSRRLPQEGDVESKQATNRL